MAHERPHELQTSKSSGFWFYNIITHWGHPGEGMQKIEPKSKRGIKESWIEPNGLMAYLRKRNEFSNPRAVKVMCAAIALEGISTKAARFL